MLPRGLLYAASVDQVQPEGGETSLRQTPQAEAAIHPAMARAPFPAIRRKEDFLMSRVCSAPQLPIYHPAPDRQGMGSLGARGTGSVHGIVAATATNPSLSGNSSDLRHVGAQGGILETRSVSLSASVISSGSINSGSPVIVSVTKEPGPKAAAVQNLPASGPAVEPHGLQQSFSSSSLGLPRGTAPSAVASIVPITVSGGGRVLSASSSVTSLQGRASYGELLGTAGSMVAPGASPPLLTSQVPVRIDLSGSVAGVGNTSLAQPLSSRQPAAASAGPPQVLLSTGTLQTKATQAQGVAGGSLGSVATGTGFTPARRQPQLGSRPATVTAAPARQRSTGAGHLGSRRVG